jgi:hypothetical protein
MSRAGSKAAILYQNDNLDSRFGSRMAILPPSNVDISALNGTFMMRPASKIPLPPLGNTSSLFDIDRNKGIIKIQREELDVLIILNRKS